MIASSILLLQNINLQARTIEYKGATLKYDLLVGADGVGSQARTIQHMASYLQHQCACEDVARP